MTEADLRRQRAWSLVLSILLLTILFEAVALAWTARPVSAGTAPSPGAVVGSAAAGAATHLAGLL